jgi:hypothetical protein
MLYGVFTNLATVDCYSLTWMMSTESRIMVNMTGILFKTHVVTFSHYYDNVSVGVNVSRESLRNTRRMYGHMLCVRERCLKTAAPTVVL